MYGKFENGRLIPAPTGLQIEMTFPPEVEGGEEIRSLQNVGNPTPEQYAAQGWFPVVEAERPEDGEGYHYEPTFTESNGKIVQSWERVDDPAPDPNPEISAERALGIILTGRDSDET